MSDIVERLRREGEDAMRKHLSLGMWKLCDDAADEIKRLRQVVQYEIDVVDAANSEIRRLQTALDEAISSDG